VSPVRLCPERHDRSMTDRIQPRRLALLVVLWLAAPVLALYLLTIAGNVLLWWDIQRGQVRIWNAVMPAGGDTVLQPKDVQLLWPMIVNGVLDPLEQDRIVYVHSSMGPVPAYLRSGAGHLLVALPALFGQRFAWQWDPASELHLLVVWSAIITVLPLSFGLLPVSRGRRGIRTVHLLRIWCYSLILTVWYVLLCVPLAILVAMIGRATGIATMNAAIYPLPIIVFLPLFWFWWMRATGRHLKLPRPWLVVGLLLLVSCLFVLLVAAVIVNLRW